MDNLEGLALGGPGHTYYADRHMLHPLQGKPESGHIYYYPPSPLEKEIRRIIDRTADELQKQAP